MWNHMLLILVIFFFKDLVRVSASAHYSFNKRAFFRMSWWNMRTLQWMNMKQLLIFSTLWFKCPFSFVHWQFELSAVTNVISAALGFCSSLPCTSMVFLKPGMRSEVTVVNDLADLNKWTYGESDEQVKQVSTVRFGSLFHSCVKIVKRN